MSERFKEHAWKACVGETQPWVRIPLSPPFLPVVRISNKTWVTCSLSGTAQACSTEMYTGVSWPDNQWAPVTSTSGDTFEGGVVLRGSYVNDGAASTIAGYVFLYNASSGPGGIFI
jgi:hypothetical protein